MCWLGLGREDSGLGGVWDRRQCAAAEWGLGQKTVCWVGFGDERRESGRKG